MADIFQVGDEVYYGADMFKAVVMTSDSGILKMLNENGDMIITSENNCKKTGKHYDQVQQLLAGLKE